MIETGYVSVTLDEYFPLSFFSISKDVMSSRISSSETWTGGSVQSNIHESKILIPIKLWACIMVYARPSERQAGLSPNLRVYNLEPENIFCISYSWPCGVNVERITCGH